MGEEYPSREGIDRKGGYPLRVSVKRRYLLRGRVSIGGGGIRHGRE